MTLLTVSCLHRLWPVLPVLAILAAVAGCTPPAAPLTQCEEGVAGLSHTADLVPGNC